MKHVQHPEFLGRGFALTLDAYVGRLADNFPLVPKDMSEIDETSRFQPTPAFLEFPDWLPDIVVGIRTDNDAPFLDLHLRGLRQQIYPRNKIYPIILGNHAFLGLKTLAVHNAARFIDIPKHQYTLGFATNTIMEHTVVVEPDHASHNARRLAVNTSARMLWLHPLTLLGIASVFDENPSAAMAVGPVFQARKGLSNIRHVIDGLALPPKLLTRSLAAGKLATSFCVIAGDAWEQLGGCDEDDPAQDALTSLAAAFLVSGNSIPRDPALATYQR